MKRGDVDPKNLLGRLTIMLLLLSAAVVSGCAATSDDGAPEAIIALEKGALAKWSKGDPSGFYEIMAAEETYFDPLTDTRVEGLDALRKHMAPFAGTFSIDRVELVNPQVLRHGDLAVLNFNFVGHGAQANGGKTTTSRWNTTEVFRRIDGRWNIVHSHWSYTKPELKAAN